MYLSDLNSKFFSPFDKLLAQVGRAAFKSATVLSG